MSDLPDDLRAHLVKRDLFHARRVQDVLDRLTWAELRLFSEAAVMGYRLGQARVLSPDLPKDYLIIRAALNLGLLDKGNQFPAIQSRAGLGLTGPHRVQSVIDRLSSYEARLVREASVMGCVRGLWWDRQEDLPDDESVTRDVIDAALAAEREKFPLINALAEGREIPKGQVNGHIPGAPGTEQQGDS